MKYNYDKFLSDSSDEPIPTKLTENQQKELLDAVRESGLAKMRTEENKELITCLNNVLNLASERLEQLNTPNYTEQDIDIADVSIRAIKSFLNKIQDSNIVLALDKGNK